MPEFIKPEGAYFPEGAFAVVGEDVARGVPGEIVISRVDGGHALIQLGRVFGSPAIRYFAIDSEGNPMEARQGLSVSFEQALSTTLRESTVVDIALAKLAQSRTFARVARPLFN